MCSLSWKLGGALLLVVVISIGLMFYLTNRSTTREFNQYVEHGNTMYIQMVRNSLGQFYSRQGSWSEVQGVIDGLLRVDSDRLCIADNSGIVVGDSAGKWLGKDARAAGLSNAISIIASGSKVGELYVVSLAAEAVPDQMMGMDDNMMDMGPMMGIEPGSLPAATAEQDFLDRIGTSLWVAGLIAVAVALLLGLILTRQITRPVRALTRGARHIAGGDLAYRVGVRSKDEIGELARSFNAMADSLEKSEQARRRLVTDIAHELRTPLSVVEGMVDGMLDGVFEPTRENLTSIKEETALLTRLISDLRELSLAESGQLKLELAPVDITALVQRKLSQAELKAREKGVELKMPVARQIPSVEVDATRIEQVMGNLVDNAIKHTPSGGSVTVSIDLAAGNHAHRIDRPHLVISVADTGEGIPAEHLPGVFERFYRVEDSRSRSAGGAGLGLAIVKQMVEAHGGRVWAESEPGKGSTFYVALPVAAA